MGDTHAISEDEEAVAALFTPVSPKNEQAFVALLTQHGAVCERQGDSPGAASPSGLSPSAFVELYKSNRKEKASLYHIHFPKGTKKQVERLLDTLQCFAFQFPDGFKLYGVDLFEIGEVEDQVVLFLPTH